jgi:general secretion pathway protein E
MKELLIQTAKRTGIVDAEVLAKFLEESSASQRIDEVLLVCPNFTEEQVLRLFAAALGNEFFSEIPAKQVPPEFIQTVPATYAQHHSLIGIKTEENGELVVILSKPLDIAALDNVSKMTGMSVRAAVATRASITAVIDVAYEQRTTVIEEVVEELD